MAEGRPGRAGEGAARPGHTRKPPDPVIERARELLARRAEHPGEQWCRCGAARSAHAGRNHHGRCPTRRGRFRRDPACVLAERAAAASTRPLVEEYAEYERRHPHASVTARANGMWGIGPSDAGTCAKEIEYRERPPEGYTPLPGDYDRAAEMGRAWHEHLTRIRAELYPWRQFRVPITLPGLDRPGEGDEYDPVTATYTDYKTVGEWKWEHRVGVYGAEEDHWSQGQMYAFGLVESGRPVERVRILVCRRATGEEELFERPYDFEAALDELGRLVSIAQLLDMGRPLPREKDGPAVDGYCAKVCVARAACWNMTLAEAVGVSPEHYTLVHDDADAEYWLGEYDDARRDETGAKRRKKTAAARLDGLPEGTYGPYSYGHRGGRLSDPTRSPEARVAQLEAFYDLPDGQRPPLVDLDYPTVRTRSAVQLHIARKRAAAAGIDPPTL